VQPFLGGVLDELLPPRDKQSIRIKLPSGKDFESIVQDQQTLLNALKQTLLHPAINARVEIKFWEPGSLWIILALSTVVAVKFIGQLFHAAAVVRKEWLEGSLLQQKLTAMGVENEMLAHTADKHKALLDDVVRKEARALCDAFEMNEGVNANEQLERVKHTLRMLSELVHRGAEAHPELMAPAEARQIFPDYKALDSIQSLVKQITERSAEE
jgi:hypothetical protein